MTAITVQHHEPGTVAWLAQRRFALGGSEIAAVLGLSPWESRYTLWQRKKGFVGNQPDNSEMEWGRRIEPIVIEKFLAEHPEYVAMPSGTYVHSERRWQTATPDALLSFVGNSPDALLEIKTSPFGDGWGQSGTDDIPVYYRCQVLWYLDVLGLTKAHVAVLISGCDYREYVIELDDAARADLDQLRAGGEEFITSLINGDVPDIDRHSATLQVVRELHPDIDPDRDVEVPSEIAGDYLAAVIAEREAKKDKEFRAAQVINVMGDARNAHLDGVRFAFRMAKKTKDGEPGIPYLMPDKKTVDQLSATDWKRN